MEFEPTKEDLQHLREWIKKTPHIVQHYDDHFLAAFVRAAKGSLQKAKTVLENFNALGMNCPDVFGSLDPLQPRLQENLLIWFNFPLAEKSPGGEMIMFGCLNPKMNDPSKSHILETYRYLLLTFYVLLWENNFGNGKIRFVFIVNNAISIAYVKELTPTVLKQMVTNITSGLPIRIKSSKNYNVPAFGEHIVKIIKMCLKSKIADRYHVYSTLDKLAEDVPQKMLPKEFGGDGESIFVLQDNWKKKVESYRQRFLEEERLMRELDHLRPRKAEEDYMDGTFRKLSVD